MEELSLVFVPFSVTMKTKKISFIHTYLFFFKSKLKHNSFIKFKNFLFIYIFIDFWLQSVFVALPGLSLPAVSRGLLSSCSD